MCASVLAAGDAGVAVVEWPWSAEARWGSDTSRAEELERLADFTDRLMPAAERAGVKMSVGPNESLPLGSLGHRPVFAPVWEVERFFETVPSPANGIGISRRATPSIDIDIVGAIRRIGRLGRIHHVEFDSQTVFQAMGMYETHPDGLEVMQAYKGSVFVLRMVSAHASALRVELRGKKIGCSYSHGYLRGLVEEVNA